MQTPTHVTLPLVICLDSTQTAVLSEGKVITIRDLVIEQRACMCNQHANPSDRQTDRHMYAHTSLCLFHRGHWAGSTELMLAHMHTHMHTHAD